MYRIFISAAVRPTQPPIRWTTGVIPPGYSGSPLISFYAQTTEKMKDKGWWDDSAPGFILSAWCMPFHCPLSYTNQSLAKARLWTEITTYSYICLRKGKQVEATVWTMCQCAGRISPTHAYFTTVLQVCVWQCWIKMLGCLLNEQNTQCTYNVTMRRVRVTIFAVEKQ